MGYTTEFRGEFRCRRPVEPMIDAFLTSIESDLKVILIFADWLEDREDQRAARVRTCESYQDVSNIFHALRLEQTAYLRLFSRTRRMKRDPAVARTLPDPVRVAAGLPLGEEAEYFVGGSGHAGQDHDASVREYNWPPGRQPGLWCQWVPSDDGSAIRWSGHEKFYDYVKWLEYLIEHFLRPWGYLLEGDVTWQGEQESDQGVIRVHANVVEAIPQKARRRSRRREA